MHLSTSCSQIPCHIIRPRSDAFCTWQEHCLPDPPGRPSLHRDSAANKWRGPPQTLFHEDRQATAGTERPQVGLARCAAVLVLSTGLHRHSQERTAGRQVG